MFNDRYDVLDGILKLYVEESGSGTVAAALLTLQVYHFWSGLVVDIGRQASPQEVFFGTEYRDPDVAQFVVPIEAVAAVFFALVALMFVGLGQALGRAFDAYPNRVLGCTLNIGGSLAGVVAFPPSRPFRRRLGPGS